MNNLIALNNFGFLAVTGKDALKFLQGYTTCELNELSAQQSSLGAICNIKGRMIANFRIIQIEDGLLLRLNRSLVPVVESFLKKYIIFSKATLENRSDSLFCYGLIKSEDDLSQTTENPPLKSFIQQETNWQICVNDAPERYEIWSTKEEVASQDSSPWLAAEIQDGFAWVDELSQAEYLPQMFNLHNLGGISFEKGCYLGQEIVVRMQYRGKLKKTLHSGSATHLVDNGEGLFFDKDRPIGKIVAANKQNFLAVIQTKSADESTYHLSDHSSVKVDNLNQVS